MPRPASLPIRMLFVCLSLAIGCGLPAAARAIETSARQAILIDASTGTVLFEHNADERMPTSSMSKILTMYLVFDALEQGRLSLDDTLPVSEYAWRTGGAVSDGSTSFLELHSRVRVEDLIRGVIVQSGNDASIVLAEGLAGSEEAFARQMNQRAREIGMNHSSFRNAPGLPDPNHYSTARDLAILAQRLITDHQSYYHYYSERDFTYNNHRQGNRNPLLYRVAGADGLKTGHTREAGYGLAGTVIRDGRRLILVINGLPSMRARAEESERLIEWGFREFEVYPLFRAGEVVESAAVWMGSESTVPLTVVEDLGMTLRRTARDDMRVVVRFDEPAPAPIRRGDQLGTLVITAPDMPAREVPLVAGMDIERRGFLGRAAATIGHLAFGWVN